MPVRGVEGRSRQKKPPSSHFRTGSPVMRLILMLVRSRETGPSPPSGAAALPRDAGAPAGDEVLREYHTHNLPILPES